MCGLFGRSGSARSVLRTALWTTLTLSALAVYVWVVGPDGVGAALRRPAAGETLTLAVAGFLPVVVWGCSLYVLLAATGVDLPIFRAIALFVASVFLNNVTPFGQLGGDPPSALLVARDSGARAESALAALGTLGGVNRVAALLIGVLGATWYGTRVVAAGRVREALVAVTALGVCLLSAVAVVWRRRQQVADRTGRALARLLAAVDRRQSVVSLPGRDAVVERVNGFVRSCEHIASRPWALLTVVLLGLSGQVVVAGVLWLAVVSVGATAPFVVVVLLVPATKLSGITPTPGGVGGAQLLLATLLVSSVGLTAPTATAAALLYRAAAFWLPTVVGAVVTVGIFVRSG